ncbi:hypothetical protein [uncultured Lactobacillus sp.]|uniref:hypothetical protein n=1 Tax=uncultured Lactobacillus sp. TaxID=153152 RepID=UPI002612049B|nr:hypothetical protein [uncultured Lactobacillus sp.]
MSDSNFDALKNIINQEENTQETAKDEKIEAITNVQQSSNSGEDEFPFFLDYADRVAYDDQPFVAKYKRENNTRDLDKDKLLWAVGEEVANFEIRKGQVTPVLKLKLEVNNAPVYVFANEAGNNYRHLDTLIDQRVKIAISTLLDAESVDKNGQEEYIALGSIRQAEWIIGRNLKNEFDEDPEKFKNEVRNGVVTQVVDAPANDSLSFRFISFTYEGMLMRMLARDFYYQSFMQPLHDVAYVGMKFEFKITDILEQKFEDMPIVKRDQAENRPVPKGITYQVQSSRLSLIDKPDDNVKSLYKRKAEFKAHIVRYHPVSGILVEIAPGWWIKGVLSTNSLEQPSVADEKANTPVIVRLDWINEKTRRGRAYIVRFPRGVARTLDPHNQ